MNKQTLLFDVPTEAKPPHVDRAPLSHRRDPETSREAARRLAESGKLTGQRRAVLEALRKCDGVTRTPSWGP